MRSTGRICAGESVSGPGSGLRPSALPPRARALSVNPGPLASRLPQRRNTSRGLMGGGCCVVVVVPSAQFHPSLMGVAPHIALGAFPDWAAIGCDSRGVVRTSQLDRGPQERAGDGPIRRGPQNEQARLAAREMASEPGQTQSVGVTRPRRLIRRSFCSGNRSVDTLARRVSQCNLGVLFGFSDCFICRIGGTRSDLHQLRAVSDAIRRHLTARGWFGLDLMLRRLCLGPRAQHESFVVLAARQGPPSRDTSPSAINW